LLLRHRYSCLTHLPGGPPLPSAPYLANGDRPEPALAGAAGAGVGLVGLAFERAATGCTGGSCRVSFATFPADF